MVDGEISVRVSDKTNDVSVTVLPSQTIYTLCSKKVSHQTHGNNFVKSSDI